MKKLLFIPMLFVCYVGMGQAPNYGYAYMRKYTCLACHSSYKKIIGPSFESIAKKYSNSPDQYKQRLSERIIRGGSGVWGSIPMPGNREVTQDIAKKMVEWILSKDWERQ